MKTQTIDIPTYDEFWDYFCEKMRNKKDDPKQYTEWLEDKYEAWKENDWKKEKQGKYYPIKKWKSTLLQCLSYRMPNKVKDTKVRAEVLRPTGKIMDIENELIIGVWNHWSVMRNLKLKHTECFDILYKRGVFKHEDELMPANKRGERKPWKVWYDTLEVKSRPWAVAWAIDEKLDAKQRNAARNGNHPLNKKLMKLKALEYFFSKYPTENKLVEKLRNI